MSYFTAGCHIDNPRAWLVGAVCNASRSYWRHRARVEDVEGTPIGDLLTAAEVPDIAGLERTIFVKSLLERVRPRTREVLRLHYFEGFTAKEIASRLGTTAAYAQRLISRALREVRNLYRRSHETDAPRTHHGRGNPPHKG